eukprot:TRINITY_DN13360_c0_g1_i1.p1 TRINITY_DN13360_c0_g1~~TRINITY_DN13360_c0_g1_i1.p1  ORF type:complete len:177 (+),score=33.47 TRINITY_DN13360_c0_g1_i1:188-718(+)
MQECSNKILAEGELAGLDTDLIGPFGYCADISRTWIVPRRAGEPPPPPTPRQKELYQLAHEQVHYNASLLKPGSTFAEFMHKAKALPEKYLPQRYSCLAHGVGHADEYPCLLYEQDVNTGDGAQEGTFQPGVVMAVESYVGEPGGTDGVKLERQVLITDKGPEFLDVIEFEKSMLP